MKVIKPLIITPDDIISTTAEQNTEPVWDGDATYEKGTRVVYDGRRGPSVYQSSGDGNKGLHPDINPDDWVRVGPTNKWAIFDGSASTLSNSPGGFECSFVVKEIFNALAFFEVYGASLTITVTLESGQVVFTHEQTLIDNSMIVDGYTYCFSPFDYIRDGFVKSIPPFSNATVTVRIDGRGSTGVGEILVGTLIELGCTEWDADHGIRDYSFIKDDQRFGHRELEQGNWAKRNNLQVYVDHNRHRYVSQIMTGLRGMPAVFIGSENPQHEPLVVFGFAKNWHALIKYPTKTLFNMEIEGLI